MNLRQLLSILHCTLAILVATTVLAQSEADDQHLDSLRTLLSNAVDDETRLQLIDQIAHDHYNADSTLAYAEQEIALARQCGMPEFEAQGLRYVSWAYFFFNDYPRSCKYSFEAIIIADSINDQTIIAKSYYNLGNAYSMMQDANTANDYYHKALEILNEQGDSITACDILRNIAQNNYENRMYKEAYDSYNKALAMDIQRNDVECQAEDYCGLGAAKKYEFDETITSNRNMPLMNAAKQYLLKARNLAIQTDYSYCRMRTNSFLIDLLNEEATIVDNKTRQRQILDSCQNIINETYDLINKAGYDNDRFELDLHTIDFYIENNEHQKAFTFLDSLSNIFLVKEPDKHKEYISGLYKCFSHYYAATGNYKKACHYEQLFHEEFIASKETDYAVKSTQAMAQADFDQKMKAQEIETKKREMMYEAEAEKQTLIIIGVVIVLVLVSLLAIVVIRSYVRSRKTNHQLDIKNKALEEQKEEIETQNEYLVSQKEQIEEQKMSLELQNEIITTKNRQITDSINYASLIQQAALPSGSQMNNIFGEHLVIYRPLNIVSGDFYWTSQVGKYKMLAVADCTGHGVPGAFLSMLGMSILNDISKDIDTFNVSAGVMLDTMRSTFKDALHQRGNEEDNHDGIDIALIIIDIESMTMHYAGAFRPVIIMRDGESIKIDPDRMPIGVHYKEADHFTDRTFDLMKGDVIYMFSDGMTDQFGYDAEQNIHKFTAKRLRSLLTDVYRHPFSTQKLKIELAIDQWRMDRFATAGEPYEQTDDAILVGVRV